MPADAAPTREPKHNPQSRELRRPFRLAVGAAANILISAFLAASSFQWVFDAFDWTVFLIFLAFWLILSIMPIIGAVLGFRAYAICDEKTCQMFKSYMLGFSIAATVICIVAVTIAAILWGSGYGNGDFVASGLLGLSLLNAVITVLPVPFCWFSFACAYSGAGKVRQQLASGGSF